MSVATQTQSAILRVLETHGTTDYTYKRVSSTTQIDPLHPSKGYQKTVEEYQSHSMITSYDIKSNIELNRSDGRDKTMKYYTLYTDPASIAIEPEMGDSVVHTDGTVFFVVESHPYEIAGLKVLHEVTLRG